MEEFKLIKKALEFLGVQEYAELLDEFMSAVKQTYGEKVLVQVSF